MSVVITAVAYYTKLSILPVVMHKLRLKDNNGKEIAGRVKRADS